MRNLEELNINEGGQRVNRAPPTAEVIAAFESEFDVSLPQDYLALLTHSNGGHPELDMIVPAGRLDLAERGVDRFYYLNEDREGASSLWAATTAWRSILKTKMIPIAVDGGGNPFVLDLAVAPAKVLACLHDEGFSLVEMASSFEEFIDNLELDPDMI